MNPALFIEGFDRSRPRGDVLGDGLSETEAEVEAELV